MDTPAPKDTPTPKDFLVSKSNSLVEAAYQITLNEQRILLASIAKIDSRKPMPREIRITAQEFADSFELPSSSSPYEYLREASEKLFDRKIRLDSPDGRETREIRWLQERAIYHAGQGAISLVFSDHVKKHLSMLHRDYTRFHLGRVAGLQSYFSIRLYEQLIRFRDTGLLRIPLDDFKKRLGIEEKYPRFPDLKRRVIAPAVRELEAKSGLIIDWSPSRERRAVVGLEFRFEEKDQLQLALDGNLE